MNMDENHIHVGWSSVSTTFVRSCSVPGTTSTGASVSKLSRSALAFS